MDQVQHITQKRKWKQISEHERYKIEALWEQGLKPKEIADSLNPKRDRRTIERELELGFVEQKRLNPSYKKYEPLYLTEKVYRADTAQMRHCERASNKGRGLKIANDHKLADFIEEKIKKEKWSPDVIIGRIREQGLVFQTSICTKTVYNYIDKMIFRDVTNKDLWVKKIGAKKRDYRKIRKVALNNKTGKSITERPKEVDDRSEKGHWEIDLVVGNKVPNRQF